MIVGKAAAKNDADILILSAGFGSRLGDLTKDRPKPLVPVAGVPVIDYSLKMVAREGFREVFVNLHYHAQQIRDYIGDGGRYGLRVNFVEEPIILGTGGAMRNIEEQLKHQTLLTLNSDLVLGCDFSLRRILETHERTVPIPLATLTLRHDREAERYGAIGIDDSGRVTTFLGQKYFDVSIRDTLMYLGVQAVSRELFRYMPSSGSVFSITRDVYPKLLADGGYLSSFIFDGYWADVGTSIASLERASKEVANGALQGKKSG